MNESETIIQTTMGTDMSTDVKIMFYRKIMHIQSNTNDGDIKGLEIENEVDSSPER